MKERFGGLKNLVDRVRGIHTFHISYEGHDYELKGPGSEEEFERWFKEYTSKAPRCFNEQCNLILFPGDHVGRIGTKLLFHYGRCISSTHVWLSGSDGVITPEGTFGGSSSRARYKHIVEVDF